MDWAAVAIILVVTLGIGILLYLRRAGRAESANAERRDVVRGWLFDLESLRDDLGDDSLQELMDLIETVRYSTPAGNEATSELDGRITDEIAGLVNPVDQEALHQIMARIAVRNKMARR